MPIKINIAKDLPKWTQNTWQSMRRFNASEEETSVRIKTHDFLILISNSILIGAAYLVKHKKESKEYIAKKILLGSL